MAQIDSFLTRTRDYHVTRIVLQGNAPVQLELPGGPSQGEPIENARIGEIIEEILPLEARQQLEETGGATFIYASPFGPCSIEAKQTDGLWHVEIVPPVTVVDPADAASSSGMSLSSTLPPEIHGFNWGGFLMSWIWAIGNNTWIGLLGLVPCVGFIFRIILGFKGNEWAWKNRRWNSVQQFRSTQTAWGIVGACLTFFSFFIYAAILFPVFARARENARRVSCQQHMQLISVAVQQYTIDHNGKYPTGTTMAAWQQSLAPYMQGQAEAFNCPGARNGEASYVLNPKMAGASVNDISAPSSELPVFFDLSARHFDGIDVAFADGHVQWYRGDRWDTDILPKMDPFTADTK